MPNNQDTLNKSSRFVITKILSKTGDVCFCFLFEQMQFSTNEGHSSSRKFSIESF